MAPNYTKTIVCLANSRKLSGRCVAGKEIEIDGGKPGAWIRPISSRQTGELSRNDYKFENGHDLRLLDIIRIPMIEPRPHGFQSENHLIDDRHYWTEVGSAAWRYLKAMTDPVEGPLWDNSSSSYNGMCDRVAEATANQLGSSLRLVETKDLSISVAVEGAEFGNGKRKVRGRFSLNGAQYLLAVTDPVIEHRYLEGKDGEFKVGQATLCISLGEPYDGYAYKLIAGVFLTP